MVNADSLSRLLQIPELLSEAYERIPFIPNELAAFIFNLVTADLCTGRALILGESAIGLGDGGAHRSGGRDADLLSHPRINFKFEFSPAFELISSGQVVERNSLCNDSKASHRR